MAKPGFEFTLLIIPLQRLSNNHNQVPKRILSSFEARELVPKRLARMTTLSLHLKEGVAHRAFLWRGNPLQRPRRSCSTLSKAEGVSLGYLGPQRRGNGPIPLQVRQSPVQSSTLHLLPYLLTVPRGWQQVYLQTVIFVNGILSPSVSSREDERIFCRVFLKQIFSAFIS